MKPMLSIPNAATSIGTSNLVSWVSTQTTVRPSTRPAAYSAVRYRSGQSTTTSCAEGNRAGVAKVSRASTTVVR